MINHTKNQPQIRACVSEAFGGSKLIKKAGSKMVLPFYFVGLVQNLVVMEGLFSVKAK